MGVQYATSSFYHCLVGFAVLIEIEVLIQKYSPGTKSIFQISFMLVRHVPISDIFGY